MARVVHFEIQADDIERAKAFYAAAFDWEFQDWSGVVDAPYWGIITGPDDQPGINGGLLQRPAPHPAATGHQRLRVHDPGRGLRRDRGKILAAGGRRDAQDGDDRHGVAGLLPRHRGQHLRHPPARRERRLSQRHRGQSSTSVRTGPCLHREGQSSRRGGRGWLSTVPPCDDDANRAPDALDLASTR